MAAVKIIFSIVLYIFSFFSADISGDVVVKVDPVTSASTQIVFEYTNNTNKPVYGPAAVQKLEKKEQGSLIDLSDKIVVENKEYAITLKPGESERIHAIRIIEPLEAGEYVLTVSYDIANGFGNSQRITKEASAEFSIE